MDRSQAVVKHRKRKAESQDNERLSKRMSLLNLERNGQKLYVPVEQPSSVSASSSIPKSPALQAQDQNDDMMQLDDSKHKVYIYDLDAELSDSESSDDGRLVFLPDIQKHLRDTRIPPVVLANSDGELAGMNNQLVLYNVPSSLTVPEAQDSVRKAIIETRARARARQEREKKEELGFTQTLEPLSKNDIQGWESGINDVLSTSVPTLPEAAEDDPDAMDLG